MRTIGFHNTDKTRPATTPWVTHYQSGATIFGRGTYLPIDYGQARNDNTLVVGSSGTGKTYSFVEPNILQANANYVVADAKGDILANTGMSLRAQGYHIQVLNLVDLKHSMTYNPLYYMHDEMDVVAFAHQVIGADIAGNANHRGFDDPFWTNAPASLLEALIMFTEEFLPVGMQTMGTALRLGSGTKSAFRCPAALEQRCPEQGVRENLEQHCWYPGNRLGTVHGRGR